MARLDTVEGALHLHARRASGDERQILYELVVKDAQGTCWPMGARSSCSTRRSAECEPGSARFGAGSLGRKQGRAGMVDRRCGFGFGVSPFGIYRNQHSDPLGSETNGLQNYDDLYADVLMWAAFNG